MEVFQSKNNHKLYVPSDWRSFFVEQGKSECCWSARPPGSLDTAAISGVHCAFRFIIVQLYGCTVCTVLSVLLRLMDAIAI
jgi:hypothetical protein